MATKLTKKQKEALTDKITGLIRTGPALRMTTDSSVNEMNINQISGELNRIHYRAIGKEFPAVINIPVKQLGSGDPSPDNIRPIVGYEIDGIGTVYGGDLNIETSVLTASYGIVDLGTLNWDYVTTDLGYAGAPYFQSSTISDYKAGTANIICERYKAGRDRGRIENNTIAPWNTTTAKAVVVRDDSYTEAVAFKAAMSGVQLVYEQTSSVTYTLTPQQMLQLLDQL